MDGTGDGRGNGHGDGSARAAACLAKKLMRLGQTIPRVVLWCALLATTVSAAASELPSRAGAVSFDHGQHAAREGANCAVCHHTSTGFEVRETCRQCHRPSAPSLPDSRTAFHGSCIGCHEKLHRGGQPAGPVKRCSGCHRQADVSGSAAQRP